MAYLHLVHGSSLILKGRYTDHDLSHDSPEIREMATKVGLEPPKLSFLIPFVEKAKVLGLMLKAQYDDEEQHSTLFFGKELYPNRHLYQGQTETCPIEKLHEGFEAIWQGVFDALQSNGFEIFNAEHGIVASLFD